MLPYVKIQSYIKRPAQFPGRSIKIVAGANRDGKGYIVSAHWSVGWPVCLSWKLHIHILLDFHELHRNDAGLGGTVGYAVRLETRRLRVQPPLRLATFFRGDWSWNIFYGHSLPSADSRRAVVSFWQKNVHNTG